LYAGKYEKKLHNLAPISIPRVSDETTSILSGNCRLYGRNPQRNKYHGNGAAFRTGRSAFNGACSTDRASTDAACLDGVRLVSDRQPTRLRVDEHTSGSPAVWLHADGSSMAWIIVDIGERDWTKLAYQFGHELGHVMANTWQAHAEGKPPCQWLEEALVEAFSIRGLGRLAQSWSHNPPFAGDNAFGQSLAEYERDSSCVEALGALNRWPGRSGIPIEDYFRQWLASCMELGASPVLPTHLRGLLGLV
jgi:hypothetical protein